MRELQALVAQAVADRGYREGWTDEQYAARQICKAVEELSELQTGISWFLRLLPFVTGLRLTGQYAQQDFDQPDGWDEVVGVDLEVIAAELPDVVIPLLVLADTLGIDLEQAIREKVLGDIGRGVRGEKPSPQEQISEYEQIIRNVERALEPVGWKRAPSDVAEVDALAWEVTRLVKRWEELASEEACIRRYEVLRREKQEGQEWIPLSELRAGAIFETQDGKRALKTPHISADNKTAHCVSLKSGRKIYLSVDELVREIVI